MNATMISVLSAMATAVWSVWTWQSERQKVRDLKRDEMTAQYVNNFIVATQELQRKLFRILAVVAMVRNEIGSPSSNDNVPRPRGVSPSKRSSQSATTLLS